jgi:hypothetical protein
LPGKRSAEVKSEVPNDFLFSLLCYEHVTGDAAIYQLVCRSVPWLLCRMSLWGISWIVLERTAEHRSGVEQYLCVSDFTFVDIRLCGCSFSQYRLLLVLLFQKLLARHFNQRNLQILRPWCTNYGLSAAVFGIMGQLVPVLVLAAQINR